MALGSADHSRPASAASVRAHRRPLRPHPASPRGSAHRPCPRLSRRPPQPRRLDRPRRHREKNPRPLSRRSPGDSTHRFLSATRRRRPRFQLHVLARVRRHPGTCRHQNCPVQPLPHTRRHPRRPHCRPRRRCPLHRQRRQHPRRPPHPVHLRRTHAPHRRRPPRPMGRLDPRCRPPLRRPQTRPPPSSPRRHLARPQRRPDRRQRRALRCRPSFCRLSPRHPRSAPPPRPPRHHRVPRPARTTLPRSVRRDHPRRPHLSVAR